MKPKKKKFTPVNVLVSSKNPRVRIDIDIKFTNERALIRFLKITIATYKKDLSIIIVESIEYDALLLLRQRGYKIEK